MMRGTTTVPAVDADQERRLARAARNLNTARTQLEVEILEAFLAGAGVREISRTVGMSHPGVKYILDKHAENPAFLDEQRKRRAQAEKLRALKRRTEQEYRDRPKSE